MEPQVQIELVAALIAFLIAMGCLMYVRHLDRKNYIIQKATPLPLSLVNERDDVWLTGVAECESPLSGPHFEIACLCYDYMLEERVTRITRDSKGRTRVKREWRTRDTDSGVTGFSLRDGDHTIYIEGRDAEFKDLANEVVRIGDWRHTLNYFPYPSDVNAVGSISEGKKHLEAHANIPLIVTTLGREEFVKDAESGEVWARRAGFVFFWTSMTVLFYGLMDWKSWPVATRGELSGEILAIAVVPATILFALRWSIFKYNSMVRYRNRVENAWRQIDVDLSMRYDLIPNLVDCVKGAMEHERTLIESLTQLRKQAFISRDDRLNIESNIATSVSQTIIHIESYPDLKAQGNTFKLTRQLRAIEEKIAHGRLTYNETVREYNDNIKIFPQVIIANRFGFIEHIFFSIPDEKKQVPDIEIGSAGQDKGISQNE